MLVTQAHFLPHDMQIGNILALLAMCLDAKFLLFPTRQKFHFLHIWTNFFFFFFYFFFILIQLTLSFQLQTNFQRKIVTSTYIQIDLCSEIYGNNNLCWSILKNVMSKCMSKKYIIDFQSVINKSMQEKNWNHFDQKFLRFLN